MEKGDVILVTEKSGLTWKGIVLENNSPAVVQTFSGAIQNLSTDNFYVLHGIFAVYPGCVVRAYHGPARDVEAVSLKSMLVTGLGWIEIGSEYMICPSDH